ncbi:MULTISPECIES: ABC transporter substrate-binding protein [unclassified Curtobacterium]|uniref:ABC transporter substrate-binding protein n=1 Tax=unclassified Curtobacterium TaxID=257496 RepID=UPI000DA81747|nr:MULTISPECIES: sugar ABC transporter substrate-binding protein [unclassified Curtobacterium]MDY1005052.1 sugar ABC transporter substrate-binding protein [Curtobacterium sp. CFBP9011]WIE61510.1 sugar ABC transporter substrate-binding protein [Curtobacterium sp. MCLR17_032]
MTNGFSTPIDRRTLFKFGGAGLALAGIGSLAACSTSGGGGSGSGTVKMLYFGEQSAASALQKAIEPKIKRLDKKASLEVTAINGTDWNDFLAKVLTQIASGDVPDIVSVATEGQQLLASKNLLTPLDEYVTKNLSDLHEYFTGAHPVLLESTMYQGHLYTLPDSFNAGSMFYSTDLFDKAGLARPAADWTMDDFHSSADRLAKVGGGTYAFDWVVRLWGSWTSFLYANDGNLLEEGKYSGGDWLWKSKAFSDNPIGVAGRKGGWKWGDPTANSDAAIEALQYVIDLQKSGASPSPDVGGGATLQGLMASGRIGMTIGGGFWAGGLHNAGMKDGSFDVVQFPTWKSNKSLFGAGGYGIFNSSKQKDLAFEVIKLMVQPESFDSLWPGNVTTPAQKSLMTAERYSTTGPEHWSVFYDQLDNSAPISAPPYYNALATALNQRTTQAISSGNAKKALDGLQADIEKAAAQASS